MAATHLQAVLQHVRRAVLVRDSGRLSDGELLESFIADRDEAAFETLVRRHGPMVLGVCRRVLRNPDDADDAFQATFLVLMRKAASVQPREKVGHWLYGVARTTATRANALAARRRRWEKQIHDLPDPEAPHEPCHDWQPLLDEELGRLPEKYRLPIVLCDLESRTIKDAAQTLAWPLGTVAGRLARGRKLLAQRLTRRGVAVSASALAVLLLENAASARVPAALVINTLRLAHSTAAAGPLSVKTVTLTEGVVKTMAWKKLKVVALVFGLLGFGVGSSAFLLRPAAAQQPPAAASAVPQRGDQSESQRYHVAIRLMEALPRPTAFHPDREILEFPGMVMADDAPMPVRIAENHKGSPPGSLVAQRDVKAAYSLRTSIHHLPSGKVAVKIAYRQEPAFAGPELERPAPFVRDLTTEVVPGQIGKLPLRAGSKHQARQWLEVVVSKAVGTSVLVPPHRASVYQVNLDISEVQTAGSKTLTAPRLQVIEGQSAQFLSEVAKGSRLTWSARIKKLPDDRLQLDMLVERAVKKPAEPEEFEVRSRSLKVRKLVQPGEKVNLDLDGVGKTDHPTRFQVIVKPLSW